jgi:hypothetical protein
MPANPRTWLISTGRFNAIDAMPVVPGSTLLTAPLHFPGTTNSL